MESHKWTVDEVSAWLNTIGLARYKAVFVNEGINGENLLAIDEEKVKTLLNEDDIADFLKAVEELKTKAELGKEMENYLCTICIELLYEPVTCRCGHSYCQRCLQSWLKKSTSCPACRADLPAEVPSLSYNLKDLIQARFKEQYHIRSMQTVDDKIEQALEKHKRNEEQAAKEARLKALKRHFNVRVKLDDSVLEAVLEMCNNDVNQAQTFLTVQGAEPAHFVSVEDMANGYSLLPKDYSVKPAGFKPLPVNVEVSLVARIVNSFMSSVSYSEHCELQTKHYDLYARILRLLLVRGVDMNHGAKARVLAVVWARKDWELSEFLLGTEAHGVLSENASHSDNVGIPEILKALRLLDTKRQIAAKEKRLETLRKLKRVRKIKIGTLVSEINDLKREDIPLGTLSGALARHVKKLIARIPQQKLEFFALQLPTEPWKELADLLHIRPTDGVCLPWFMGRAFGVTPPEESIVAACKDLNHSNSLELLRKYRPPYSFVRLKIPDLSEEEKTAVSEYISLDQLIWWHEDLNNEVVNKRLIERLKNEKVSLNYGKLMERMLYLSQLGNPDLFDAVLPLAEAKLRELSLELEPPVVVFGDASYSMDVAIRVSVIMSSIVAALSNAELRFFNTESIQPAAVPTTASQVLDIAQATKADKQTAPAAALWEYYEKKKQVNVFVLVSDEKENVNYNGHYFHQLFYKYYTEVHPAKLVMISFLEANEKGQMSTELEKLGIKPLVYSLDSRRPDLTKLDGLLAHLSTDTKAFEKNVM